MVFRIAIVGRPNVGKSTLFNRLVGRRAALVDDTPGVTRDYREGGADLYGQSAVVFDTAGMDPSLSGELDKDIRRVTEVAIGDADLCLFMFDARAGVLPADREIFALLRRMSRPVVLVANKCEGEAGMEGCIESSEFGLGWPIRISAEHGEGISDLKNALLESLPVSGVEVAVAETDDDLATQPEAAEPTGPLKIAVVGRPNAGKSSLINRIVGEDRLVTGATPGTTRDAIAIATEWYGTEIQIHDTAGMRKRSRIVDRIEKLSVSDALSALRFAETVVLVIDAAIPLEVQDLRIADLAEQEGRPVVFAVNKWDTVKDRRHRLAAIQERLDDRLPEVRGAPLVTVSATTGEGMRNLHEAIHRAWRVWNTRISTGLLNRWLEEMTIKHPPPAFRGKPVRLRYMTQVKARPPSFVAMCSHPRQVSTGYRRYLKNGLRHAFGLDGTPIRIRLRSQSEKNPYAPRPG